MFGGPQQRRESSQTGSLQENPTGTSLPRVVTPVDGAAGLVPGAPEAEKRQAPPFQSPHSF